MPDKDNKQDNESIAAPIGDLISSMARGVAEAQSTLDANTIEQIKAINSDNEDGSALTDLQLLGYQPTWYRIPEAEVDIKVSMVLARQEETTVQGQGAGAFPSAKDSYKLYAAPVDAGYANTFDYKFEATSTIKFKIVAVPPSTEMEATKVVPPGLLNMKWAAARQILVSRAVPFELKGEAEDKRLDGHGVTDVSPPAGTILTQGQHVVITLGGLAS